MMTYIALLRAINVGGNNLIKMADLKVICGELGFENVRTYIQSGNVAFESVETDKVAMGVKMSEAIAASYGFTPPVFVLDKADLQVALDGLDLDFVEEKFVYFYFLEQAATHAKIDEIEALLKPDNGFKLADKLFYLHCAEGAGKSKLAAKIDRLLGVKTTARNLRTVKKLIELAG
ncbi:MAG: DUF1697 domain-containing protein [Alphaproteobacteria bacterium]|nr:DUF1697 domain-containing protein [Alphaproteobacteria bacterium]